MVKKEGEIYLGGGSNIKFEHSQTVTTFNTLKLQTIGDGFIMLDVKIEADFSKVPEKYHEVFMNMMSARYLDSVSFGDNPFSRCIPPPTKKWWQFWKANVNI